MSDRPLHISLSACEASGDVLGAQLIQSLRKLSPVDIQFSGIAGPAMRAVGCKVFAETEQLSVMGLIEVVSKLPTIFRLRRRFVQLLLANPPDIFIGIDGPDFNLGVARRLKAKGIKTVQYVSPSIWAWRGYRICSIGKSIDRMLTLFPFETEIYEQHSIPVSCVGHPQLNVLGQYPEKTEAKSLLGMKPGSPCVALLPGSRRSEIESLLSTFVMVAQICRQQDSSLQFVLPIASTLSEKMVSRIRQAVEVLPEIHLLDGGQSTTAMAAADVVLMASGTAAFECMLVNRPMVVAYRLNPLSYALLKRLIRVKHVSLPNHLTTQPLVREFIQSAATEEAISAEVLRLLETPAAEEQMQAFDQAARRLQAAYNGDSAAITILQMLV
ncbi:MAG: lipid-A-disaccharide synthase [Gammaproteobacteria bacterium]